MDAPVLANQQVHQLCQDTEVSLQNLPVAMDDMDIWCVWKKDQMNFHSQHDLVIYIYKGSLNKFPYFFRMGTFIDGTHMKL